MRKLFRLPSILAAIFAGSLCAPAAFAADVTFTATMGHDGDQIKTPVTWTVTKLDKAGKPEAKPTAVQTGSTFHGALKTGHYVILAQSQGIATKEKVFVGSDKLSHNVVMGLAHITLNMIASRGRKPITEPIEWEVYTYQKGKTEAGVMVDKSKGSTASFSLMAGGYVVRAKYKDTKADLVVPLIAGQSYDYTINLYAGYAKLAAVAGKKAVTQKVTYQIVRQKPNENGEYELIAEKEGATPNVMLREGNYVLIARYGKMWGREDLAVQAGQTKTVKVTVREGVGAPIVISSAN
ncbi:MAG: hypothetical protein E6Q98_03500 [Rhodospirillaceae bacterium]|nr:MAG: hypothetical protein E6Q98_03500 [Rhodospirillaceae bacterium]